MTPDTASSPAHSVEILRDNYGVPHVYADAVRGLFFGNGYALAEDRLFQLELTRLMSLGRLAEYLGQEFLELDQYLRTEGCSQKQLEESFARGDDRAKEILTAFADGISHYVEEYIEGAHPHRELFGSIGLKPSAWSPTDIIACFLGQFGQRWFSITSQVLNSAVLDSLITEFGPEKGCQLMDDIVPNVEDPKGVTAIPRGMWKGPSPYPVPTPAKADRHIDGVSSLAKEYLARNKRIQELLLHSGLLPKEGSQYWAAGRGRTPDGGTVMLDGPQMGWFSPSHVHEVGLHGAGWNAVGMSPVGIPGCMFGYNDKIAWGGTAGIPAQAQTYAETLNETGDAYWHKGEWRLLETRQETYRIRGAESVTLQHYSTAHGNVVMLSKEKRLALSQSLSWRGSEMRAIGGQIANQAAKDWEEFLTTSRDMCMGTNWYYTDHEGNMGFSYTGAVPQWPEAADIRFVLDGSGKYDWDGFQSTSINPYMYNPPGGSLASWNPNPAEGWFHASMMPGPHWQRHDHTRIMTEWFDNAPAIGEKEIKDFNVHLGAVHEAWYFMCGGLIESLEAEGDIVHELHKQAFVYIRSWDGRRADPAYREGSKHPGFIIFEAWCRQLCQDYLTPANVGTMASAVFAHDPPLFEPAAQDIAAQRRFRELTELSFFNAWTYDVPVGLRLLMNALEPGTEISPRSDLLNGHTPQQARVGSFKRAVEYLSERLGSTVENWSMPTAWGVFGVRNHRGVPMAREPELKTALMNRGCMNHVVKLSKYEVKGINVMSPGNSEVRQTDGQPTAHSHDQFVLWRNFEYKPMLLFRADVDRNVSSRIRLEVTPAVMRT